MIRNRATVGMFRGLSIQTLYAILPIIVYSHIMPVTKGFNYDFFKKFWVVCAVIAVVAGIFGMIGFAKKDVYKENFGEENRKI